MRTFSLLVSPLAAILNSGRQGLLARGAGLLWLAGFLLINTAQAATPTIVSVTFPPPGTYGPSSGNITFTVTYSEPVRLNTHGGVGVPQLIFEVGSREVGRITDPPAVINAFTASKNYVLPVSQGDLDLDGVRVLRFNALGASYDNGNGEAADLTIPGGSITTGILVDGVGPANTFALAPGSDLGPLSNDRITSDKTPTITGVTEPNATVNVSGAFNRTLTADGAGNWSVTALSDLTPDGQKFIIVTTTDLLGNFTFHPSLSFTLETVAPVCSSIIRNSSNPVAAGAGAVNFFVTFNEDVYGVTTGSFDLATTGSAGGSIALVTPSGDARTFTVTVGSLTGAGNLGLNLKASASGITDLAGNEPTGKIGQFFTVDLVPPTALSVALSAAHDTGVPGDGITRINSSLQFEAFSNEGGQVQLYRDGNLVNSAVLDGGNHASVTDPGPIPDGPHAYSIFAVDLVGNRSSASVGTTVTVDTSFPAVQSITRFHPSPTALSSVSFTVVFTEPIIGLNLGNFTLATSGLTGASITGAGGGGTIYQVNVNTGSGSGTLGLTVVPFVGGITDTAGNLPNSNFPGLPYVIDRTAPVVTSVSVPPDGTYLAGQTLEFTVILSESVGMGGPNPGLDLAFDSGSRAALYVTDGSTPTALKFQYVVQPGDADYNGIVLGGSLNLNGALIKDVAGNNLVLTLNGVASTTGIRVGPQGPQVTASGGATSYVENAAPVVVDGGLTVVNPSPGDPETGKTASALVTITGGYESGLDFLAIPDAVAQAENISTVFDPQHGTLTIGCLGGFNVPDSMERVLRAVTFVNTSEAPGTANRTIAFTVTAPTGANSQTSKTVTVTPVNDPPTLNVPASITVVEDSISGSDSALTGITVGDLDAGTAFVKLVFTAPAGSFFAGSTIVASVTGSGTPTLSLTGSVADLNTYLAAGQVSYLTALNSITGVTLDVTVNDLGNFGTGGALTATASLPIVVTPVNDAPVILAPATIDLAGEGPRAITGISCADPDVDAGLMNVQFFTPVGVFSGPSTGGVNAVAGSGPSSRTLSGTLVDINNYIAAGNMMYTPPAGASGNITLTLYANDLGNTGLGGLQTTSTQVTLVLLNDPPVITAPASITVTEDVASPLAGISVNDDDAGASALTVTLNVTSGLLSATSGSGVTATGTGTGTLILVGSSADLNAFIAANQVTYLNPADATADVSLSVSVDDGGNAGSGGPKSASTVVTLTVDGINDAPRISAAPASPVTEDVASPLLAPIIFIDADAGTAPVKATFSVPQGILSAGVGNGVTVSGSGTGTVNLTGSMLDLNLFMSTGGLVYTTALNATAEVTLTITLDDQGNTGTDPGLSGTATSEVATTTMRLIVTPVNDAPVNTVPPPQTTLRNLSLVFSAVNGNAITVSDVDAGGGTVRMTLTAANGLISLSGTSGLSFLAGSGAGDGTMVFEGTLADINVALNGLTFTPTLGYDGPASLEVTSNDLGLSGSGGYQFDSDTIVITVRPNPRVLATGTTKPDGLYPAGEVIALTVQLEQVVFVDTTLGTPSLLLETGVTDRQATYVSGSGTDTLTFNYTVQPGDVATDLDYESTAALALNGATIQNVVGDPAILTLAAPGSAGSISGAHALVIDGVAPVIVSVEVPPNAAYRAGQQLDFTARFAETVTVNTGGTPRLPLTLNGGGTVFASYLGGSGTDALVFRFTVVAGQNDTDGVTVGAALGLNGGVISDVAGNPAVLALNNVAPTAGVQVDTTAPIATISSPSAVLTRGGPVTYTVTYTDALFNLSTLAVADITLNRTGSANATTVAVAGSGHTRTVTLSGITGDGTLGISVGANTATDTAGNQAGPAGPSATFEVDNTPPAVALSGPTAIATRGGPVSYTVTYTDLNFNASTLVSGDINLNRTGNANASSVVVTGSGATRTVTLSGISGDGTLGISLVAGTATDTVGNSAATAGPGATFIVDNTLPVVTLSAPSAPITKGGPVSYTVTYTDLNFSASTLAVANIIVNKTGTANAGTVAVAGSGTTRTVTLSGITGDGTLGISLAAGTAIDTAGNLAPAAGPATTFTVDNTPPSITLGAPSLNLTRGGPVTYAITYADPNFSASTLAAADVVLNRTGTANAGTMAVSGAGTTRTVTLSGITGDGTLGISLKAGTASDTAGNLALATGATATFTVDNTPPAAPVIASITADTGISASDRVTADTSLVLSGTAEPGATAILTHAVNGVLGNAVVNAGGEWVFDYAATTLGEGMHEFTAVARDPAGNTSVASAIFSVRIDTTDPVVASLSGPPAGGYGNGRYLDIAVTFSEPVLVDTTSGLPGLEIMAGAKPRVALYQSGSGGATWVFRYIVQADETGMGLTSTEPIRLNGGTIKDVAGNNAVLANPGLNVPGILFDGLPPEISISEPSTALTRHGPVTYRVSYRDPNFYSSTLTESDVVLNRTGTANGTVDMVSPLDPLDNFRTMVINNITGDGALSLSIKSGSASDRAGNSALAAGPGPVVLVDNTPPVAPVLTGISLDSGVSGSDQITSDRNLLISGTAEPRSLVTVTRELSGEAGKVTADATGQWTLDYRDTTLADGTYKFSAEATDVVGNTSPVSTTMTVIVDNQAPVVTISAPSVPVAGYRGSVSYVVTYADANLVTGTLKATDVSLVKTGVVEGEVSVASAGLATWTVTIANLTGNGTVAIALAAGTVSDTAGNLAPAAQASTAVQVDALPPSAPVITLLDPTEDGFGSENVTRNPHPVLHGKADPGAAVLIFLDDADQAPGAPALIADVSGNWTYLHSAAALSEGPHHFVARARDPGGNLSVASEPFPVTVDLTVPTVTISGPSRDRVETAGVVVTYQAHFADANLASVSLKATDVILNTTGSAKGNVLVNAIGDTRTITITNLSGAGTIGISLRAGTAVDLAGNLAPVAGPSATFQVNLVSLEAGVIGGGSGGGIIIQGVGLPGAVYEVQATEILNPPNWVTVATVNARADGAFVFQEFVASGRSRFYRVIAR